MRIRYFQLRIKLGRRKGEEGGVRPRRRTKYEIYMDILRSIKEGKSKQTQIRYSAGVSRERLIEHLDSLIALGYVTKVNVEDGGVPGADGRSKRVFRITGKGDEALEEGPRGR